MSNQDNSINLSKIIKLGELQVRLEGDLYMSPFSQEACVWFEWVHSTEEMPPDRGCTFRYGVRCESSITVKSIDGHLTVNANEIMLYLAPSFDDKAIVDGKEQYVKEFPGITVCLYPDIGRVISPCKTKTKAFHFTGDKICIF